MPMPRTRPHLDVCFTSQELGLMKKGYTVGKLHKIKGVDYRLSCTIGDGKKMRRIKVLEKELQQLKNGIKNTPTNGSTKGHRYKWSDEAREKQRARMKKIWTKRRAKDDNKENV